MTVPASLLFLQAAATLALAGLIWTIQIVHYPLFSAVGEESFLAYEQAHTSRITFVVAPLMFAELAAALALLAFRPALVPPWALLVGVGLVAVVWASTFFVQVPLHNQLSRAYDADSIRLLVVTNWIRTAAWTARGGLVLWMLAREGRFL